MEVLQRTANRGSVSTGIDNSCKFEEDNSEFLWKTFSGEGTGTGKTFTVSAWVKRTELGGIDIVMGVGRAIGSDANDGAIRFNSDQFQFVNFASNAYNVRTNAVFRDTSAWYHIMAAVDTTQGTDSNRVKLYVNGEQQTSLTATAYPTLNYQFKWGRAEEHMVGARPDSDATPGEPQPSQFWSGYMADVYFVDGQQLAPTDFGEVDEDSGIWKPIDVSGLTFGTNGFYLDFEDASDLGDDKSGNGNDFAEVNLAAANQATDTPTNSFSTWNILNRYFSTTINEGATKVTNSDTANWRSYVSTIAVSSGKWYAEFEAGGTSFIGVGDVAEITGTLPYTQYLGQITASIGYYSVGLLFYSGASQSGTFAGFGDGDVISCALDKDNGFVYWAKNGVWQNSGDPTSGATGTGGVALTSGNAGYEASDQYIIGYSPLVASSAGFANYGGFTTMSISSAESDSNGYGTFEYAPPTGYYALCTKNLAEYG